MAEENNLLTNEEEDFLEELDDTEIVALSEDELDDILNDVDMEIDSLNTDQQVNVIEDTTSGPAEDFEVGDVIPEDGVITTDNLTDDEIITVDDLTDDTIITTDDLDDSPDSSDAFTEDLNTVDEIDTEELESIEEESFDTEIEGFEEESIIEDIADGFEEDELEEVTDLEETETEALSSDVEEVAVSDENTGFLETPEDDTISLSEQELDGILDGSEIVETQDLDELEDAIDRDFEDVSMDGGIYTDEVEVITDNESAEQGEIVVLDGHELNKRLGENDYMDGEPGGEIEGDIEEFTVQSDVSSETVVMDEIDEIAELSGDDTLSLDDLENTELLQEVEEEAEVENAASTIDQTVISSDEGLDIVEELPGDEAAVEQAESSEIVEDIDISLEVPEGLDDDIMIEPEIEDLELSIEDDEIEEITIDEIDAEAELGITIDDAGINDVAIEEPETITGTPSGQLLEEEVVDESNAYTIEESLPENEEVISDETDLLEDDFNVEEETLQADDTIEIDENIETSADDFNLDVAAVEAAENEDITQEGSALEDDFILDEGMLDEPVEGDLIEQQELAEHAQETGMEDDILGGSDIGEIEVTTTDFDDDVSDEPFGVNDTPETIGELDEIGLEGVELTEEEPESPDQMADDFGSDLEGLEDDTLGEYSEDISEVSDEIEFEEIEVPEEDGISIEEPEDIEQTELISDELEIEPEEQETDIIETHSFDEEISLDSDEVEEIVGDDFETPVSDIGSTDTSDVSEEISLDIEETGESTSVSFEEPSAIEEEQYPSQSDVVSEELVETVEVEQEDVASPEPRVEQPATTGGGAEAGLQAISKGQLKEMLLYIDNLFGELPEEKIKEFAKSKYYDLYNDIFDELGI